MLKETDLRIGNLVLDGHEIEKVNHRMIEMLVKKEAEFDPIPLTEEGLIKFGFEWCNEAAGYFDSLHAAYLMYPKIQFHPFCTNDKDCWIEIEHVHQLQNLYFALTGNELTLTT